MRTFFSRTVHAWLHQPFLWRDLPPRPHLWLEPEDPPCASPPWRGMDVWPSGQSDFRHTWRACGSAQAVFSETVSSLVPSSIQIWAPCQEKPTCEILSICMVYHVPFHVRTVSIGRHVTVNFWLAHSSHPRVLGRSPDRLHRSRRRLLTGHVGWAACTLFNPVTGHCEPRLLWRLTRVSQTRTWPKNDEWTKAFVGWQTNSAQDFRTLRSYRVSSSCNTDTSLYYGCSED